MFIISKILFKGHNMCKDCGCSISGWHTHADGTSHTHENDGAHVHHEHIHTHADGTTHSHAHYHSHDHKDAVVTHSHTHDGSCGSDHAHPMLNEQKTIEVISKILSVNDAKAAQNRELLESKKILAINLMSSPGAGKTTLLEATIKSKKFNVAVVEGDLETNADADRIIKAGAQAHQISTGQACHLDAFMVETGLSHLNLDGIDLVFVENVGNLVCPASYDVGTHLNVVLLSVPEGDDKVAKYPVMFRAADLLLITKSSLMPHFEFSMDKIRDQARKLNPKVDIIQIDSKTGDGIEQWLEFLQMKRKMR